ncbi:MAG: arginase [Verrucomicrobia bacterium]|nr:arginase [Verrucomicrobiota bacterium]
MNTSRNYFLISACSGWGAQIRECEAGPDALRHGGCLEKLRIHQIPVVEWDTLYPLIRHAEREIALSDALPLIVDFNQKLAEKVLDVLKRGFFPVVIGGDHSIAVGTWNGVGTYLEDEPFGMIWIDAHMDSHTTETTPSGAWHGMPLAALMGHGALSQSVIKPREPALVHGDSSPAESARPDSWDEMTLAALMGHGDPNFAQLKREEPVLLPQNLCLVGVRSFEEGEAELLKRLNVKIYMADEVNKRGVQNVLKEAVAHVTKHTKKFCVSLDLDVIDPSEAPGVGSPEPGGLSADELIKALPVIGGDERLAGFELVEFNPSRDKEKKTFSLCYRILEAVLSGGKGHG